VQVLYGSGPVWDLDVTVLDTPQGDVIEISSSSYGLSLFSLKAGSHRDEGVGAAQRESYSVSVGDLWPEIDSLDVTCREGTSVTAMRGHLEDPALLIQPRSDGSKPREGTLNTGKRASLDQASGSSYATLKGCGGGSARNKASRILSDAPRDISPRMKRPFVNRSYSPLTGMDISEWEMILEQLIIMGYVVKEVPASETDEQ
jgi:hypothetical protein